MSKVFNICRGSYRVASIGGSIQPSMIVLDGLKTDDSGYLVTDFRFSDMEKVGVIQCFNDYNHIYAFGHDPENSGFSVSFTVFLGDKCMEGSFKEGSSLKTVLKKYLDDRVSKKKATIEITLGQGTTFVGLVQSCEIGNADAEMNMGSVTISGKCVEVFH